MEDKFYNVPDIFWEVDGNKWFSTRYLKDYNGVQHFTIPKSSYYWNNTWYIFKGLYKFMKLLLGSSLIGVLIKFMFQ